MRIKWVNTCEGLRAESETGEHSLPCQLPYYSRHPTRWPGPAAGATADAGGTVRSSIAISDFTASLPIPPPRSQAEEDQDTRVAVQGSFGNTEEGRTGRMRGFRRPGRGGDNTALPSVILNTKEVRGVRASVYFYPLSSRLLPWEHTLLTTSSYTQLLHKASLSGQVRKCLDARQEEEKAKGQGCGGGESDTLSRSLVIAWARAQQV